jgi:hypothetical protein
MAEHLRTCLRCQAELSGYRRLLRVLRSMRDEPVVLPALAAERLGALPQHLAVQSRRNAALWAIAGALGAVVLAAFGTGVILARSTRHVRTMAGAPA